jgi:hypothetical protein
VAHLLNDIAAFQGDLTSDTADGAFASLIQEIMKDEQPEGDEGDLE